MSEQPLLSGRYRVGRLIGHGGMGDVYLGTDTRLGRTVAIKLLRPQLADDPVFQRRFRNETTAAARMTSPYIVRTFDAGQDVIAAGPNAKPQQVPFLVMEYVEGKTLKERLEEGPIDRKEALQIIDQVLRALEYSHRAGIIHRDIKPGNVMLTSTGNAKVMDFGVARALSESEGTVGMTGSVVGTALYFAPEQARGDRVDGRADLYSVGVILYQLLVGRLPFKGDSPASIAYQHVNATAPTPSSLNESLTADDDRLILGALAKDPDRRYQSADDLRRDLERLAQGMPTLGPTFDNDSTQVLNAAVTDDSDFDLDLDDDDPSTRLIDKELRKSGVGALWAVVIGLGVVGVIALLWLALLQPRLSGPDGVQVAIPDIAGNTYEVAAQALSDRGLTAERVDESSTTVANGRVISADPEEGTLVTKGSTVTVHVSTGMPMVEVPDVSGLTQDEAKAKLEAAGLSLGTVSSVINDQVDADHVISSSPIAASQVRQGTSISLTISSGMVIIPDDLVGQPINNAIAELRDLGITGKAQALKRCQASGYTVQFISPKAGEQVAKNTDSVVTLYYYIADNSLCEPEPSASPSPEGDTGDTETH